MNWEQELQALDCVGEFIVHEPQGKELDWSDTFEWWTVCLEGIDGAGKTTAAKDQCRRYAAIGIRTIYLHAVRVPPEDWETQWIEAARLSRCANDDGTFLIWDRCWIGELVYGAVLGDRSLQTLTSLGAVWKEWRTLALHLRLYITIKEATRRLEQRGDDHDLIEHLDALNEAYDLFGLAEYDID